MNEYGKMDPFSFVGSNSVDYPVRIRMYVALPLPLALSCRLTMPS
jgi:hypothetical protein